MLKPQPADPPVFVWSSSLYAHPQVTEASMTDVPASSSLLPDRLAKPRLAALPATFGSVAATIGSIAGRSAVLSVQHVSQRKGRSVGRSLCLRLDVGLSRRLYSAVFHAVGGNLHPEGAAAPEKDSRGESPQ